jgi:two-component system, OmpR family, alkaline phosphatase synthesis response regulator PhoP
MEKIKVLLVDDDLEFGNIATKILQTAGYEVFFQNSLLGLEYIIMKLNPNIIILDVMIGEENSLERINDIRLAADDIPIMCISSLHDSKLKTKAANNGAMIYMEKPFDMEEFLGWVKRYAKHKGFNDSCQINIGDFTIDTESRTLYFRGANEKTLGHTEFCILKLLWVNKDNVISRQELKDKVWQNSYCSEESINNVIYHLRKYFERAPSIHIDTIRGVGVKMWTEF